MAKNNQVNATEQVENAEVEQVTEPVATKKETKVAEEKSVNQNAKKATKKKKERKPNKAVAFTKETVSELKKVTWPTFGKVVKQTAVVLAFVLIVGIVLFGIDRLLSLLFDVLVSAL